MISSGVRRQVSKIAEKVLALLHLQLLGHEIQISCPAEVIEELRGRELLQPHPTTAGRFILSDQGREASQGMVSNG